MSLSAIITQWMEEDTINMYYFLYLFNLLFSEAYKTCEGAYISVWAHMHTFTYYLLSAIWSLLIFCLPGYIDFHYQFGFSNSSSEMKWVFWLTWLILKCID